jgi:hypothetical protein
MKEFVMKRNWFKKTITAGAGFAVLLALLGAQSTLGQSYSGRATVVNISDISQPSTNPIVIADTGPLPGSGGDLSVLIGSANYYDGAVTLQNASVSTSGTNDTSVSAASVQNFSLEFTDMSGDGVVHILTAASISANATANLSSSGVTVSGSSQITGLVVDGVTVAVTGAANQTISFDGFTVELNEQSSTSGAITVTALQVSEQGCMNALIVTASADIGSASSGCPPCVDPELGLGVAGSGCTVLELGPSQVSINGPAGGILGNVYIAPGGSANFSGGGEYLTGNIYLGAGATYQNSGLIVSGSVFYNQNLSAQISAAYAANAADASLPATQTFGTLDGSSVTTITGTVGLNVIDVQNVNLSGKQIEIIGPVGAKFIFNVTGNFVLTGGGNGPQIYVAGGVQSSDVLFNIIGSGQDVAFSGGGGGANCCAAVVDGTLLAPYRKIALSPGLVNGEVISAQNISIVSGSSVRCPSCQQNN